MGTIEQTPYNYNRFPFEEPDPMEFTDSNPSCGLFRSYDSIQPEQNVSSRILNGEDPYPSQFPFSVCIMKLFMDYSHLFMQNPTGQWCFIPRAQVNPMAQKTEFKDVKRIGVLARLFWTQSCTGTLIHSNWILTAAHCFEQVPNGSSLMLSFGGSNCFAPLESRRISVWKFDRPQNPSNVYFPEDYLKHLNLHTKYRQNTQLLTDMDIALIRLDAPLNLPQVASFDHTIHHLNSMCYESSEKFTYDCGTDLYAFGYGQKGNVDDGNLKFMHHTIQAQGGRIPYFDPRLSFSISTYPLPDVNFYAANIMLTDEGFLRNTSVCPVGIFLSCYVSILIAIPHDTQGDSGGPSLKYIPYENSGGNDGMTSANARAVLVGILSTGPDCLTEATRIRQLPDPFAGNCLISVPALQPAKYTKVGKIVPWIRRLIETETPKGLTHPAIETQDEGSNVELKKVA